MAFFKRLFGGKEKPTVEPMHGTAATQSQDEQDATRVRMESEMAGQKERRDADAAMPPPERPLEGPP